MKPNQRPKRSRLRLPRVIWRLFRFLPPRLAYSIGLGTLVGNAVLLLKTVGRKTGLPRTTPLLYDELDGVIYVAPARGAHADWYRNVIENPNVDVTIGSRQFRGCAEPITDQAKIVSFLHERMMRRPRFTRTIFRIAGLGSSPTSEQLAEYASERGLVAIRPMEEEELVH